MRACVQLRLFSLTLSLSLRRSNFLLILILSISLSIRTYDSRNPIFYGLLLPPITNSHVVTRSFAFLLIQEKIIYIYR